MLNAEGSMEEGKIGTQTMPAGIGQRGAGTTHPPTGIPLIVADFLGRNGGKGEEMLNAEC